MTLQTSRSLRLDGVFTILRGCNDDMVRDGGENLKGSRQSVCKVVGFGLRSFIGMRRMALAARK